jgi:DNA polymerase-3 subunit beta
MKFLISRLELNDLINRVQGIVSIRPSTPILGTVLLEAVNNELILTTTDMTVGIRCFTETKVLEEGKIALPMKKFAQLVRELTSANLEVTCHHNVCEFVADASRFKLNGVHSAEFPALPSFEGAVTFTMSQPVLKDMFFRTAFAVSKEDNRYVLNGVLLQVANSVATFVATDAKRLSRAHVAINLPADVTGAYSIPLKAIEEILRNLTEDSEDQVIISLLPDRIAIEAHHVTIVTKLLQGDYPDYNQLIPTTCEMVLRVHREEFTSILRQISLFTTERSPSIRFTFEEGQLQLTKNDAELGGGAVSMPVEFYRERLDIAFHPTAFLDALRHCREEVITLGIIDAYNPGVIIDQSDPSIGTVQPSPLYVVMPMRLAEV